MKLMTQLKESISRKHMLNQLKMMGFDDDSAKEELDSLIYSLKVLPDPVTLYRIVIVDNKSDIDLNRPGSHYSHSKRDLLNSHTFLTGSGEKYYLITVSAPKELIDVNETINNEILYPNETEITLKNKGKGVKIISVNRIKT